MLSRVFESLRGIAIVRKPRVLLTIEEELERELANSERRSLSKVLLWLWTAVKNSKWLIVFALVIFLLYIGTGPQISHFRGDLTALNEGVSELITLLDQVNIVRTNAAARLRLDKWAKENPRPLLGLSGGCNNMGTSSSPCKLVKFGSHAPKSVEEDTLDKFTEEAVDKSLDKLEEALITLRRLTISLAGIATSTDRDEIIQNVIDLQNLLSTLSQKKTESAASNNTSFNNLPTIDLWALPSLQSIPWIPDLSSVYLNYVRSRVLKDIVHATNPLVHVVSSAIEIGVEAIEQQLSYIYYSQTTSFIESFRRKPHTWSIIGLSGEKYSEDVFVKLGLALQERANEINAVRKASLTEAFSLIRPAYDTLDYALQGIASERSVHTQFLNFANAVYKARVAFTIFDRSLETDLSKKKAPSTPLR